jgi:hypothetical protein
MGAYKRKFDNGGKVSPEEKLGQYMRIPSEPVGGRIPSAKSKLPPASDAARLAAGEQPMGYAIRSYASDEAEEGDSLRPYAKKVLSDERQKISELADQYKRETRGVKDTSVRGKIRELTGMKKGGSVSSASKRADGIAVRGKTKGRMV